MRNTSWIYVIQLQKTHSAEVLYLREIIKSGLWCSRLESHYFTLSIHRMLIQSKIQYIKNKIYYSNQIHLKTVLYCRLYPVQAT